MMIAKKFRKGDRYLALLMSVVFTTVYSSPISAQPNTSTLSQLPTTENLSNRSGTQHPGQAFGGQLAIFLGHEKLVTSAKFSPDGRYILTTSWDETARLWDTQGNILIVFRGHEDSVHSAEFSPDGRQIFTVSKDDSGRLWDSSSGKLLAEFPKNTIDIFTRGVFSPNGRYILATNAYTTYLWDTSANTLRGFEGGGFQGDRSAVFSPDGQQILTEGKDNTARLWDTSDKLMAELRGHENAISSAVFSRDGRRILTASWDHTARLWDTQGNTLAVFQGHQGWVNSVVFSPNGRQILTASHDNTARLWDSSGNLLVELRGHESTVRSAEFSPDGRQILTVSSDKTARLWDTQGNLLAVFQGGESYINSAKFSPDGRQILTSSSENARLWDISAAIASQTEQAIALQTFEQGVSERNAQLVEFRGHKELLRSAVFSPDGRYILTASLDKTARLWDNQGKLLTVFQGHEDRVFSAVFSPNGRQIMTTSEDKTARLWDTSGNLLVIFRGYIGVTSAVFSPDGRYVLTASSDNMARLWDTQGNLLAVLRGHKYNVNSAVFSPDGRYILTANKDGIARLSDISGNILVEFQGHGDSVLSAVFSPDGRHVLTASFDNTARLWDVQGNLLVELQGHQDWVRSAVFSPDGRYILTASSDKTARLWDNQGNLLAVLRGHEDWVNSAEFSPDGHQILTASSDETARLWDVSTAIALQAEQVAALRTSQASVSNKNAPQAESAIQAAIQLNQQDTVESRQQALQKLEEALKLYRADNNSAKAAHTLLLMGNIHANLGQFQTALDSYNQALPLSRQAGTKAEEAAILNSLGELYNNLADPKTALDYHKQALPLLYQLNDKGSAAKTFNNIGDIQAATEQWENALSSYNKALIISRPAGDLTAEATALMGIGNTYITSKEWSTALNAYNQSLIIFRYLKDKIKETTTLNQMGKIHAALGENSTALEHYKQALALAQQLGYKTEEANIHYNQAILNRQQNNLTAAKTDIETSIQIIESLRTQIASQELRQSYFARNQDYYQFYIDLLMQLHQQTPDRGYDALALHISERARARILLEQLTEAGLDLKADLDPALKAEEQRLTQALNAADRKRINLLAGSPSNDELEAVKAEIDGILNQLQNLEVQIRRANPAYANLKYPDPLTLDGIQTKILDDKTLLLQYALGKERSYLFLVSKTGFKTYKLPPKAEIEATVEQYRELLLSPDFTDLSQGEKLSQMLLGQIAGELKGQRLVIVGDGKLQLLPFAALPWGSGASLAPLLKNHEIITLPSATSLAVQREQWQKREQAPKTLAVIADPVFKANDPRLGNNATNIIPGDLSQQPTLRNSCGDFDRLPYTATEAEQILALVPNAQEFSALGFDANYATATNPNLGQYRIVHLATHGCIQDDPRRSNLALSFFNADGQEAANRSLKLQDIYNLKLNADLVVLSACQTGTGKEVQGEGVIGLTRGFMYAGARRVAVSLWSVNDRATSILMSDYYRQMLEQKVDPAAALRQAQLAMWQSDSHSAPYYWAAFTLQGDW